MATTFKSLARVFALMFALAAGLSPAVYGAPVELSDSRLESVTAGSAEVASHNGGLIVGNTSTALVRNLDEVQLSGQAQKNTKSLNLVNSSDTTLANGVNLWIGNDPAANAQNPFEGYSQSNTFEQNRRISIRAGEWIYGGENVIETSIESFSSFFKGEYIPETVIFEGIGLTKAFDKDGNVIDPLKPTDPQPSEELKIGIGVAFAGKVSGEIGDTKITLHSSERSETTTESEISITVFGVKFVLAEDKQTRVVTSEIHKEEVIEGLTIDKTEGVGCIIIRGSCNIEEASHSVSSINTRKAFTPGLPSPDTSAEMIVMGEGVLDLQDDYSVHLSNHAQQNSSAFNLVNGGGGILANGANLSNAAVLGMAGSGAFRQTNSIFQKR